MGSEADGELLAFYNHQEMAYLKVLKGYCFAMYVKCGNQKAGLVFLDSNVRRDSHNSMDFVE